MLFWLLALPVILFVVMAWFVMWFIILVCKVFLGILLLILSLFSGD